ncbi:hypothetical protein COX24_04185 [bacterium (Candidatus Gribaldobacteria) CG23_combo_of_CG06-09_8_20_14_all_37_87_8]|uniref:Uncharacterized protein n=1 Tax=bacterium (Candidatus Gribaldobacteria) CG23_combo_of_CG06-09_8_20_14_all_37_87_8 TaxID=2014278 RepID=A0A2G9ZDQ7_9BACT|nr:MAG: hypothetical protein COX24_04185 [bacterium (Candidatus Gribaldobacteria) CG23_combo_of_CG06-09_8_20_14_all_37_87_8]
MAFSLLCFTNFFKAREDLKMTEDEIRAKIQELEGRFYPLSIKVEISSNGTQVAIRKRGEGYKRADGKDINFPEALKRAFQEARQIGLVKNKR